VFLHAGSPNPELGVMLDQTQQLGTAHRLSLLNIGSGAVNASQVASGLKGVPAVTGSMLEGTAHHADGDTQCTGRQVERVVVGGQQDVVADTLRLSPRKVGEETGCPG
jgi:hypothetical protein